MRPISVRSPVAQHDALALAIGHERAGEGQIRAVPQHGVGRQHVDGFLGRHGFAGERGLLDLEAPHVEQAQVGGHAVAGLQQHDVARHELHGRDPLLASFPAHGRLGADHVGQGLDRFLGFGFLDITHDRIDQDHGEHDGGVHPFLQQGGHQSGREQDVEQGRVELEKEADPLAPAFLPGQTVEAVQLLTPPHFVGRQTVTQVYIQSLPDVFYADVVPGHLLVCRFTRHVLLSPVVNSAASRISLSGPPQRLTRNGHGTSAAG